MCGEAFTDLDSLIAHNEKHRNVPLFVCAECKDTFTWEGDLRKHQDTTRCASAAWNMDDHLNEEWSNVQSNESRNPDDGEVISKEPCSTDALQKECELESIMNVPNVDVDCVTEKSHRQYGRSFWRYLQVMYHKIIRRYRRYRPKKCVAGIVKNLQQKPSSSNGRKNRETNSENWAGKSNGPFHCSECGKRFSCKYTFRAH